jgi:hypothetical protein
MKFLFLVLMILSSTIVKADLETQTAVQEVQKQMHNPKFHQEAAKFSPQAKQVEVQVKGLAGTPENEQEIYNLAAEILGNMKDSSPQEMQKILEEAQRNPSSFAEKFTPEQRKKLEEIAQKLPASQRRNP